MRTTTEVDYLVLQVDGWTVVSAGRIGMLTAAIKYIYDTGIAHSSGKWHHHQKPVSRSTDRSAAPTNFRLRSSRRLPSKVGCDLQNPIKQVLLVSFLAWWLAILPLFEYTSRYFQQWPCGSTAERLTTISSFRNEAGISRGSRFDPWLGQSFCTASSEEGEKHGVHFLLDNNAGLYILSISKSNRVLRVILQPSARTKGELAQSLVCTHTQ